MTDIQVGDIVRRTGSINGATYEVWGKSPDGLHLWIRSTDPEHARPAYTGLIKGYEKVKPFFEVGKTYRRLDDLFTPTTVQTDSDGKRVAFGRRDTPSGRHYWVALGRLSFTTDGWHEVAE